MTISIPESEMIEDTVICTACGGDCCKKCSGAYHPDDLKPVTVDSLASRFADGIYAIDWWEGDVRPGKDEWPISLFIRPAHVGITKLHDPSWGGVCIHWNATNGCCFELHHRPKTCRELVPKDNGNCIGPFNKEEAAMAWVPYQQKIEKAAVIARQQR
ncbi:hypothetical protein LCGC14_0220330 [marine sediment metagenome]|uniref:Uncharacterized protein n=1 Tax=marine sediment metagenome TaxID=412755 RepID=A0A0F9UUJ1_9ZZZZ